MRALSIAATGMSSQQTNVEVISNNIANLNTTGYKRNRALFNDLLYQAVGRDAGTQTTSGGDIAPTGSLVGLGSKTEAISRSHTQGTLIQTGGRYDLAILGRGFFQVADSNGNVLYTRDGSFQPNAEGILVNSQGFELDPGITIPDDASEVTINAQGEVLITTDGTTTATNAGQITLVNFINEAGLRAEGNNLYSETESSGTPTTGVAGDIGFGSLQQSFLESSNVDAVTEITTLITAQRSYELNSRIISAGDDMLNAINQIR